jgi:predicted  nucleic acid-binding Zn-ribbon protein
MLAMLRGTLEQNEVEVERLQQEVERLQQEKEQHRQEKEQHNQVVQDLVLRLEETQRQLAQTAETGTASRSSTKAFYSTFDPAAGQEEVDGSAE